MGTFDTKGGLYCPRCDREYPWDGTKYKFRLEKLIKHVALQHPDHDPEWFDTYPHPEEDNT